MPHLKATLNGNNFDAEHDDLSLILDGFYAWLHAVAPDSDEEQLALDALTARLRANNNALDLVVGAHPLP
jgi:hypothetical protein